MKFRTEISVNPQENPISYHSKIFLLGSCFVENIGKKLDYFKFQNYKNPFGILYHPAALENFLSKAIRGYTYSEKDLFYHNERWHCFDAHSELSNVDSNLLIQDLINNLKQTKAFLEDASHIIITLGTAWSYHHLETDKTVANCHKLPQKRFKKQLMDVDEIAEKLKSIEDLIFEINPKIQLIFTVSPVRHIKDGIVENQLSKAHLLTAIHKTISSNSINNTVGSYYFPAYEIMMDDLRDYRFYEEDMLHPNKIAIKYIWEKFIEAWILKNERETMDQVDNLQKGLSHRPFNKESEAHKKFITQLQQNMDSLKKRYSWMKF